MRDPVSVAKVLASVYGHRLERPVVYTQGVALSGRLRLHALNRSAADPSPDIATIVDPYVNAPDEAFGPDDGTANFAGVCWADELAESTGDDRYSAFLVGVADRFEPDPDGRPFGHPLDSDVRAEDFFFAATLLGRAYRLTNNDGYLAILTDFLLAADTQQANGLWWHCNSSPFYWGRGNAFAALGFAEALTYIPSDHPARPQLVTRHSAHLAALRSFQDSSGMWRQVIDVPQSYLEHSATSMIGYAVARGIRLGWLDGSWRKVVDLAWDGAAERISEGGELEHVCVGTGPLPDLEAYLQRPYTDSRDDRGGAMALWFAVEMARLQRGN